MASERTEVWLSASVPAAHWIKQKGAEQWSAPDPFGECGMTPTEPAVLMTEGAGVKATVEVSRGHVILRDAFDGSNAPSDVVIRRQFTLSRRQKPTIPGQAATWRVTSGGLTSDGFALSPGSSKMFAVQLETGMRLRFTVSVGRVEPPTGGFSVWLGNRVLISEKFSTETWEETKQYEFVFSDELLGGQELTFTSDSARQVTFVHNPILIPAKYANQRIADTRPDLLLIVIDTLGANALGCYSGVNDLTPTIDALAKGSLLFDRAMASASWTLPSHASMLSGLHPHQHGAIDATRALPQVVTIAELLSSAGYRTGAVTNGAFVSTAYGMDRGFHTFLETSPADLEGTLRAGIEFFRKADSRPSFLFLHTYRVHSPYHAQERTRADLAEILDTSTSDKVQLGLMDAVRGMRAADDGGVPLLRIVREGRWGAVVSHYLEQNNLQESQQDEMVAQPLKSLYLAGLSELDGALAAFMSELDQLELPGELVLVLTSDHGEAFNDQGDWFHGMGVSDSVMNIPLMIRAGEVNPGRTRAPASSVDIPRTLAALCGIKPWGSWRGRSLLEPAPPDQVVLSFDCALPSKARVRLTGANWHASIPDTQGNTPEWNALQIDADSTALGLQELKGMIVTRYTSVLRAAYIQIDGAGDSAHAGDTSGLEDLGY